MSEVGKPNLRGKSYADPQYPDLTHCEQIGNSMSICVTENCQCKQERRERADV